MSIRSIPNILPKNIGLIHFTGIGGIGMSGIAEILHCLGYNVQGSDIKGNANTQRLSQLGIKIYTPQAKSNIKGADVIVRSSAIKDDNPEVAQARKSHIPVILRAEMLAYLMQLKTSIAIAGTHGKTTTTSLVAALFEHAKLSPTVVNGGIINSVKTNAYLGDGPWLIAEADESDGSFVTLPASIGVVTNIDPEHMESYGDFETLKKAFVRFITQLPFFGFGVVCADHPESLSLVDLAKDRRIITYGIDQPANVSASNIRTHSDHSVFDATFRHFGNHEPTTVKDITLPIPGKHNILNSLAALAIGKELNISDDVLHHSFESFSGVSRRFTQTGTAENITIIDDYAHHPIEILATLSTARAIQNNNNNAHVIAVLQPHRYSRVNDFFDDFVTSVRDSDTVIVMPIFEAGESPIDGIDHHHLAKAMKQAGHNDVRTCDSDTQLPTLLQSICHDGDMVICMGAGSISAWAHALPKQLKPLLKAS